MACASCDRRKPVNLASEPDGASLLGAADIWVVEGSEAHPIQNEDWPPEKHKLLILLPEVFTPTCSDQIKGMKQWYEEFHKLNCELIMVCTDGPAAILDWFQSEPTLHERPYKAFSSYQLPLKLNLLQNGRCKRSAVFMLKDGTIVKQEAFEKVAPSFAELHRVLWAFTTGQHCGSDWINPESGFLDPT